MSNTDELIHRSTDHVFRNDDGSRYTKDLAEPAFSVFIPDFGKIPFRVLQCARHWFVEETIKTLRDSSEGTEARRAQNHLSTIGYFRFKHVRDAYHIRHFQGCQTPLTCSFTLYLHETIQEMPPKAYVLPFYIMTPSDYFTVTGRNVRLHKNPVKCATLILKVFHLDEKKVDNKDDEKIVGE